MTHGRKSSNLVKSRELICHFIKGYLLPSPSTPLVNMNTNHIFYLGIGGQIEVHADFWGPGKYDQHPGGDRTVTLMGYASTPVGGNTIFPALGLTIKPNKGDVLFWITSNNKGDFDTR